MSSPVSIPRSAFRTSRSSRSNSVSSSSSSSSSSSRSSKYVPLHKRPGSDRSSVASSSRPSSPVTSESTRGVYSLDALLALRPLADEGMKQRMRDICPEVVMNRRMRKSLQYIALNPHLRTSSPQFDQLDPHEEEEVVPESTPSATSTPSQQRALPRRNRPTRRPLERRLQDTWKGVRVATVQPLAVV